MLPQALIEASVQRQFWSDYFWEEDQDFPPLSFCHLDGLSISIPIGEHSALELRFCDGLFRYDLFFHPTGSLIGWDDKAHWFPHVLRCSEALTLYRTLAQRFSHDRSAEIAILLLSRFVPICNDGDFQTIQPTLVQGWRSLDIFSEEEITSKIKRHDFSESQFEWTCAANEEWILNQDEKTRKTAPHPLYTLRRPSSEPPMYASEKYRFPHGTWNRAFRDAECEL